MERILIIRFSSLGDVAMVSAVVEAIHWALPESKIIMLTKEAYAPLYASDPRIEQTIAIRGDEPPSAVARMTGGVFDTVIDLHGSLRSIAICTLLNADRILRLNKHSVSRRIMILSRNMFRRKFDVLESYLDTIRPLGITGRVFPRIFPTEEAHLAAEALLSDIRLPGAKLIGIAPGSLHPEKRWSAESYALLADRIVVRGDIPVFLGDGRDAEFIRTIMGRMTGNAANLAGNAGLAVTVGVIALLDGLVCNDSGPMHLAGALQTPFAALFGPTHPDLGFVPGYPYGSAVHSDVPCSPCSVHGATPCRFKSRLCMEGITGERILRELDRMMDLKRNDRRKSGKN